MNTIVFLLVASCMIVFETSADASNDGKTCANCANIVFEIKCGGEYQSDDCYGCKLFCECKDGEEGPPEVPPPEVPPPEVPPPEVPPPEVPPPEVPPPEVPPPEVPPPEVPPPDVPPPEVPPPDVPQPEVPPPPPPITTYPDDQQQLQQQQQQQQQEQLNAQPQPEGALPETAPTPTGTGGNPY